MYFFTGVLWCVFISPLTILQLRSRTHQCVSHSYTYIDAFSCFTFILVCFTAVVCCVWKVTKKPTKVVFFLSKRDLFRPADQTCWLNYFPHIRHHVKTYVQCGSFWFVFIIVTVMEVHFIEFFFVGMQRGHLIFRY